MDTSKTISFAQAWHHCVGTTSYWAWLIAFIIIAIVGGLLINSFGNKKNTDVSTAQKVWWIAMVFVIVAAIFGRPAQVAANTSVDMAAHGHYLGY